MSKLKEVASHTTAYVDSETGEDLGTSRVSKTILVKDKTEFCFQYAKLAMALTDLDYAQAKVLIWCSTKCVLNTNEVLLPSTMKKRLAVEMQLNERTVDNCLKKLTDKGYFHKLGTGMYHLNPDITWKGNAGLQADNVEVFLKYSLSNL